LSLFVFTQNSMMKRFSKSKIKQAKRKEYV
jgi:hypothetical protein